MKNVEPENEKELHCSSKLYWVDTKERLWWWHRQHKHTENHRKKCAGSQNVNGEGRGEAGHLFRLEEDKEAGAATIEVADSLIFRSFFLSLSRLSPTLKPMANFDPHFPLRFSFAIVVRKELNLRNAKSDTIYY